MAKLTAINGAPKILGGQLVETEKQSGNSIDRVIAFCVYMSVIIIC